MKTFIVLALPMIVSCIAGSIVTYNLKADGIQPVVCIVCGMMSGIASVVIPTTVWFILQDIYRWYKYRNLEA